VRNNTRCDARSRSLLFMKDARRIFHLDADGNRVYDTDPEATRGAKTPSKQMTGRTAAT